MVKTANTIFRDWETDGVPSSGAHKPIKADIREWGLALENTLQFDTLTEVTTTTIPATISSIVTFGYASAGDGGGWPLAVRVTTQPSHAGKVRSADRYLPDGSTDSTNGGWWELRTAVCCVEQFGAKSLTQAQLVAAAGTINNSSANNTAFANATAYMTARGGGTVLALGQFYDLSATITRPAGVYIVGAGVGQWDPIYPTRTKTWEGTTLLFRGTGTQNITLSGITSMPDEGGWLEDPDAAGTYLKLFSSYNSNASGTTPATARNFSVAVLVDTGTRYGGLQHLRICNWIGTDGISDWSNTGQTSLGNAWDFGYLRRNAEFSDDYDIQVVGGWIEFAELSCTTLDSNASSERNRTVKARFQGRRGHGIRAPGMWQVTATTSNSITVHWNNEWYFSSSGGSFRGSNNSVYTYTGVSHTGTAATATFTGVTPDPSGAGLLHIRHASTGFANTAYEDCMFNGLDHVSGTKAHTLGYPDSKAIEISGFPLRGIQYSRCKAHTGERTVGTFALCIDVTWVSGQFEGNGLLTALPQTTEQVSSAPVFDTRGLQMISCVGLSDSCDLRLFKPRHALITELSTNPRATIDKHLLLVPNRSDADGRLQSGGGTAEIRLYSGGSMTFYTSSTSRFSLLASGNLSPTTANTIYLGVSGSPLAGGYTQTAFSVTSDRDQKTLIGPHDDAVLDAWGAVEWVRYKLKDAVELKGPDGARWHCGVVAQQIKEVFDAHGLDACEYGLLCFAEWDETPAVCEDEINADGDVVGQILIQPAKPAGSGWSVRYQEAEALEAAYMRRRIAILESKIANGYSIK